MNIYVIIVGAFLIILMVMFGHNPVEEARKKRALEGSSDPLVHKIEQYNKDKKSHMGFGTSSNGFNRNSMSAPAPAPGAYSNQHSYPQDSSQSTGSYYPPAPAGSAPSPLQQPQTQPQSQQ